MVPFDTSQGELDYDPFVLEIGCLGLFLCTICQVCDKIFSFGAVGILKRDLALHTPDTLSCTLARHDGDSRFTKAIYGGGSC